MSQLARSVPLYTRSRVVDAKPFPRFLAALTVVEAARPDISVAVASRARRATQLRTFERRHYPFVHEVHS
jgi:hypothetical protein